MISKKILKDYQLNTIEAYFEMVVDSQVNGQFSQVRQQVELMAFRQQLDFLEWLIRKINHGDDEMLNYYNRVIDTVITELRSIDPYRNRRKELV